MIAIEMQTVDMLCMTPVHMPKQPVLDECRS